MRKQKRWLGMVLAGALMLGMLNTGVGVAAENRVNKADEGTPVTGTPVSGGAASGDAVDVVSGPSLNLTSVNRMAGGSFKLTLSNIPAGAIAGGSGLTFVSDNTSVATVGASSYATDFSSATATVNLVAKGRTLVHVNLGGQDFACKVSVVEAMSKDDFGKYNIKNFVSECKKNPGWDWAWTGEWKVSSGKYGSTYRRIKVGDSLDLVKMVYGELKLKKCKRDTSGKKGDPFLYIKQFNGKGKKLKVNRYTDLKFGKFKLRFYFTPDNKVFGFIMTMNFKKITKTGLKKKSFGLSLV